MLAPIAVRKAGEAILSPGAVHANAPLTELSQAFIQDERAFVASRVFPEVMVGKKSDSIWTYPVDSFMQDRAEQREGGTESAGGTHALELTSYNALNYAFHDDVADDARSNEDPGLDLEVDATTLTSRAILMRREVSWFDAFFKTGVWTGDADAAKTWHGSTGSPIVDIAAATDSILAKTGFKPNRLVLGRPVFTALKNHDDTLDRLTSGGTPAEPATVTLRALAALFDVDEVLVSEAVYAAGAGATPGFVASNGALLVYAAPRPGRRVPSAGYTFVWNRGGLGGSMTSRFRLDHLSATRIETESAFDQKKMASDLGAFFSVTVG